MTAVETPLNSGVGIAGRQETDLAGIEVQYERELFESGLAEHTIGTSPSAEADRAQKIISKSAADRRHARHSQNLANRALIEWSGSSQVFRIRLAEPPGAWGGVWKWCEGNIRRVRFRRERSVGCNGIDAKKKLGEVEDSGWITIFEEKPGTSARYSQKAEHKTSLIGILHRAEEDRLTQTEDNLQASGLEEIHVRH
ncbi:hypothetical protein K438DRAFT_1768496 [Mycena galopus ATCC 62051]|nr:hypothetical protein K438DRAFT_1768496 [Mycena galopus ATCC 62051]